MVLTLGLPGKPALAADTWTGHYTGSWTDQVWSDCAYRSWGICYGGWVTRQNPVDYTVPEPGPPTYNWGEGAPPNLDPDYFEVEWNGTVTFQAGTYEFTTVSDDGVRVFVDGREIIANWTIHPPTQNSGTIALTAGQHAIRMMFFENAGGAVAQLSWRSVNNPPMFTAAAVNTSQQIAETEGLSAVAATDPDGDAIAYQLVGGTLPPGISFGADGTFSGQTTYKAAGMYGVTIRATDGKGGVAQTDLFITVTDFDTRPTLAPVPPQTSATGRPAGLQLSGSDADGDLLHYSVSGLPPGLSIDTSTGYISGTIPYGSAGTYDVVATVADTTLSTPGNDSASQSFTWTVVRGDRTPPTITPSRTPPANSNGWNSGDVTVSFACTDAESGIVSCTGSTLLTQEGAGLSVTGTATDRDGNAATATADGIHIDKTPPMISGAVAAQPNADGWYSGNVTIHWTASDALSGLSTSPADSLITGEGANLGASVSVSDLAGNAASGSVSGIRIDRTAPNTVASAPGGWSNQAVAIMLTPTDNLSGVSGTYYTVDGGAQQSGTGLSLSDEGVHTVQFWSVDKAGNAEPARTITVKIDRTAPGIAADQWPAKNAYGWNNSQVTVSFTCSDNLSGVATCTPPQTIAADGRDQRVEGTAVDNAGNSATAAHLVSMDQVAPVVAVQFSAPDLGPIGAAHAFNQPVAVQFVCTDDLSGVVDCPAAVTYTDGRYPLAGPVVHDAAGNASAAVPASDILVDSTPPTVTGAATTAPNGDGWYKGDVTIRWTASDSLSRVPNPPADSVISGEGDNLGASTVAADALGNQATGRVDAIKIDRTAPTTVATAPGGWNNTDVTVVLNGSDNLSGVKATYYRVDGGAARSGTSLQINTDGTHTVTYWSVDRADNAEAAQSVTVMVDKTAPAIDAGQTPAANAHGWNHTDVTVSFTCADATSGLSACTAPVTVASEGQGQQVTGVATDNAGNTAAATQTVNIDRTAPTITGTAQGTPNSFNWYNAPVTVTFTCEDELSGVADCSAPVTLSGEGASQSVTGNATDRAGNTASGTVAGISIDRTAPTLSGEATAAPNAEGWYNTAVTIHWTAEDTLSGLIADPEATVLQVEGKDLSATVTVTDRAGNSTTRTAGGINIDHTAPVTSADAPLGWNSSDVTVTFTADDGLSGVKATYYQVDGGTAQSGGQVLLSADGIHSVEFWSVDKAGNAEEPQTIAVKVDKTAPTVSYTGNAGTYTVNQEISIPCVAADGLSGLASDTCADITGPAYSFSVGENTYSATATDNAGNIGTGSTTFTVAVSYESLCTLTSQFVTKAGEAKSLCAKLQAAQAAAAEGREDAKAGQLRAFANEVSAQIGKTLTRDQANTLLALVSKL